MKTSDYELLKVFKQEIEGRFLGMSLDINAETDESLVWKKSRDLEEILKIATVQYNKFFDHGIEFRKK